jgi:hypothetical protein
MTGLGKLNNTGTKGYTRKYHWMTHFTGRHQEAGEEYVRKQKKIKQ